MCIISARFCPTVLAGQTTTLAGNIVSRAEQHAVIVGVAMTVWVYKKRVNGKKMLIYLKVYVELYQVIYLVMFAKIGEGVRSISILVCGIL